VAEENPSPSRRLKKPGSKAATEESTGSVASGLRWGCFQGENEAGGIFQPPDKKTARPCVEHRGCHPTEVASSNPSVAQGWLLRASSSSPLPLRSRA